jgi:type IV pilus assembly protein PilE
VRQSGVRAGNGFTLIELMIVVAIVAILMLVMLPGYQGYVRKAKRSIGRAELLTVLARQEQYFIMNKQYASRLDLLGYGASPYAINSHGERVAIDSMARTYIINLFDVSPATAAQAFTVRATPQLGQTDDMQCGFLQITSLGVKSAGEGSVGLCW